MPPVPRLRSLIDPATPAEREAGGLYPRTFGFVHDREDVDQLPGGLRPQWASPNFKKLVAPPGFGGAQTCWLHGLELFPVAAVGRARRSVQCSAVHLRD